jgi:hypothetical protein
MAIKLDLEKHGIGLLMTEEPGEIAVMIHTEEVLFNQERELYHALYKKEL